MFFCVYQICTKLHYTDLLTFCTKKSSDFLENLAKKCATCYNIRMDKYVLIDGNSLLNRAFYAVNVFTTRDGMPTNGIFGFIKLLFKILEDETPEYLTVAFDMHAPTFRHKMFDGYKATRKPMPQELVVQVPVLKDLLHAMKIHTVELEGYEADDIIGTLSRAFDNAEVLIYTGDRDSYQLVKEHVSVCFTKRGVSDLEKLTNENFYQKVGLYPSQIIDEKALMGDASDNIPGIRGVGPKTALDLLRKYGSAENVFAHLSELTPSLRSKFEGQEEISRLSHTLATIDTAVPLTLSREECRVKLPFPAEARTAFANLEFRSLTGSKFFSEATAGEGVETVVCSSFEQILSLLPSVELFSADFGADGFHVCLKNKEFLFPARHDLLGAGFFPEELVPLYTALFGGSCRAVVADRKDLLHRMAALKVPVNCPVEDVSLLRYLSDSNQRPLTAQDLVSDFALPATCSAFAVKRAYEDVLVRTKGTEEEKLYREVELPLSKVLFDMEQTGVRVDEGMFPVFSEKYSAELAELSQKIYALAGMDYFNLNSPLQLSEVLFGRLGFDPKGLKKNTRGFYSTSAEVLEKLAEKHEIARVILRYREVQKLLSTYIDGIRPLVQDGVVHTTYNQNVAATGRLSSANPNLQNIPIRTQEGRELRKLFIAREGNVLIDADYSQIELRLLAHFSRCEPLRASYREGKDIHTLTASQVFGLKPEEVTPQLRYRAKAVNFGIIYGISAFGLAKDVGCSTSEAQAYIDRYFAAYPAIAEYMDENVRFAKEHGYVTTILGRKRHIPELKSSNYAVRSFGERAAKNMPLQGSSADIIKLAMLGVSRRLEGENMRTKLVLQVHDELVLDAPLEEAERAKVILKEEMEHAVSLEVPLTVEISSGASWYDAK